MKGTGCETCSGTGYKGGPASMRSCALSPSSRGFLRGASVRELQEQAVRGGMLTLRMDGMRRSKGVTTSKKSSRRRRMTLNLRRC
jgi:type IV pilus assembly protein PilB